MGRNYDRDYEDMSREQLLEELLAQTRLHTTAVWDHDRDATTDADWEMLVIIQHIDKVSPHDDT